MSSDEDNNNGIVVIVNLQNECVYDEDKSSEKFYFSGDIHKFDKNIEKTDFQLEIENLSDSDSKYDLFLKCIKEALYRNKIAKIGIKFNPRKLIALDEYRFCIDEFGNEI